MAAISCDKGSAVIPETRGKCMRVLDCTVVVWKEQEGYVSKCPELGVASCGDTISEAVKNLREAVELYLDNAVALGLIEDIEESLTTEEKFTSHIEIAYHA
ncbi:type II toxin-antitoxin system HicB family antitoxin [Candidatus Magnetominusculus xianensis]|uniref:HicB-like antitoxin of toxin-antitoxin system domain-containing protein n=1 Tax=Candidatus Magnetominusculus xianensis TaxID=1748249 RepID=A0ABR5SJJ9_9BACT|nr:type II toxin-antitoxin system HicB family antitoxin [Candidatus Magnetominusculus xianensis]KWT94661.1 hypothetical protein ASN18_0200 [Candidatus Magnetominusculus xianensis]